MSIVSPYAGLSVERWNAKTAELVEAHPLSALKIVEVVLQAWSDIFDSRLGAKQFQIGRDIFPPPQMMAFLLHELIPLELASRHADCWRRDQSSNDKDIVWITDEQFSFEIKTSSSMDGVYGNRSYSQPTQANKKSKSGYYLVVNFDGFNKQTEVSSKIRKIRFGWLDHEGWKGQAAATGQQAAPSAKAKKHKLLTLYPVIE